MNELTENQLNSVFGGTDSPVATAVGTAFGVAVLGFLMATGVGEAIAAGYAAYTLLGALEAVALTTEAGAVATLYGVGMKDAMNDLLK